MSTPMTPAQIESAFNKWHVKFVRQGDWARHRRDPGHGAWGPVNGIGLHHTGDDSPDSASASMLWRGRSDLPGPLCNWGMRDDGVAVLIGGGRANHFGSGSSRTLKAVISESYGDYLHPGGDDTDGNSRFYGQETMYSGGHPMTLAAYRSTVRAFAAICDFHGWSAKSCIGHKEWTRRKVDPGSLDMARFRRDVQACLDAGPGNWPTKEPVLRPVITALRTRVRQLRAVERNANIDRMLLNTDKRLAKIERR